MKIEEALKKFIIQLEADGRAASTISQYRRHVRLFSHWARDVGHCGDLSAIGHEDAARFLSAPVAKIRADGCAKKATSMNTLRTSLRCFFRYCHGAGYISIDPGRLIRLAICGTSHPRAISEEDAACLMEILAKGEGYEAERDHILFCLMLESGIRLGSAVALNVEDVDLATGVIWLRKTKGNHPEKVYLGKMILQHLSGFLKDRAADGPLFTAKTGRRLSHRHVQRRFSIWLEKAGITSPVSIHSLRHTFAVRLYHSSRDIFLVQSALLHRSIASTLVYANVDDDHLRRALQA